MVVFNVVSARHCMYKLYVATLYHHYQSSGTSRSLARTQRLVHKS